MDNNRINFLHSVYVQSFNGYMMAHQLTNPSLIVNDEFLENYVKNISSSYNISITLEEKEYVIKLIKANCSIYQEEGGGILGDYEHDYEWFNNLEKDTDFEQYYWERYKNYLINKKGFAPNIVNNTLQNVTLKSLMSYLGNPAESANYSIRGLVVGDVQSGKTSNYLGLICRAADAGYKVFFLLTGTIESLRRQTQERVEEGFIGYDSVNAVDVGVMRGKITPKAFTSRNKDFTGKDDQTTTYRITDYTTEPMIFVIKKNVSVLKKLYASLKNINTDKFHPLIDAPMLMIDDEADNASINTNKPDNDPTKINEYIRKILSLFAHNNYVGFTATPFANVFINYDSDDEMLADDLFPRNFIYALESPSTYCGANKYFFTDNNNIKFITDYNDNIFPMNHKKDWDGDFFFGSLYDSICAFYLSNAIRDVRDLSNTTHRSMLINVSRFTNVQLVIKNIVENYANDLLKAIKQNCRLSKEKYLRNEFISRLYNIYQEEYHNKLDIEVSWDDVLLNLYDACKDIKVVVVNSSKTATKLDYEANKSKGLRVIAVGGLALSRGLTLEGLTVSYFYRNTAVFDVLMQMGRWFGYRDGYADLCRIYMTRTSFDYYKEISLSISQLKDDIKKMGKQGKRPEDYGIRVRNNSEDLGITAANKMRNTQTKVDRRSFYGNIFETPFIDRKIENVNYNIDKTIDLINDIKNYSRNTNSNKYYWMDVESKKIFDFIKELKIHEANSNFDTRQISNFIAKNSHSLSKFDVLLMTGSDRNESIAGLPINLSKRGFDIVNEDDPIIRISKNKTRLIGRSDPSEGLARETKDKIELENGVNCPSKDYMYYGRNPLLMIYFISPINDEDARYDEEYFTSVSNPTDEIKLYLDLYKNKYNFLVGFAIGFPKKKASNGGTEQVEDDNTMYIVNKSCNYYEKQHDEDYEKYGDEVL